MAGLVVTELHDLPIYCNAGEFRQFRPPAGQTCIQWAGAFVARAGGYLQDEAATDVCNYCQYRVGDEFYAPLGITFDQRWRDLVRTLTG